MKTIIGNEKAITYLNSAVESRDLSHAYLFVGPASVGKTRAALAMARQLLCVGEGESDCGCASCKQVALLGHPDLHYLDGNGSGIDEVREIVQSLQLAPYQSVYRIAVVAHAEKLTIPALNSFLKTLEEPKDNTIIILTTENSKNLLDTITSRTRKVNFTTVNDKVVFEYLNQELGVKRDLATKATTLAAGRLGIALNYLDDESRAQSEITESDEFIRIFRSNSIADKLSFAKKFVGDKADLSGKLDRVAVRAREQLLSVISRSANDSSVLLSMLDAVAKAEDLLRKNVNNKLVIESILLRSL